MAAIPRCAMGEEQGLRAFAHHPPEVPIIIPTLHPGRGLQKRQADSYSVLFLFLFLSSSTAIPLKFSSLLRFFPPEGWEGGFEIGSSFVIPFVDSGRFFVSCCESLNKVRLQVSTAGGGFPEASRVVNCVVSDIIGLVVRTSVEESPGSVSCYMWL